MQQLANSCIPYIVRNGSKGVESGYTIYTWASHKWQRHCDKDGLYVVFTFNIHVSVGINDATWKRTTNWIFLLQGAGNTCKLWQQTVFAGGY